MGELKILAFGDSLTEGYTDFGLTFHPYAPALKQKLLSLLPRWKVAVDVNGQSGDTVLSSLGGSFLQRLQISCPPSGTRTPKYDLVIILGGTNDLAYMTNDPEGPAKIFEELGVCYDHVLRSGASLLCLTVPERAIDGRTSKLAERARSARLKLNELIAGFAVNHQAREAGTPNVFMMDLAKKVPFPQNAGEDEDQDASVWSPDGLHMSSQGYDFVGEELARFIHSILGQCTSNG
ncbi:hypothetical protein MMC20_000446 [Loxospora ochrophaea]|nr:hypothetical protein [Loxospora ochrophaea]